MTFITLYYTEECMILDDLEIMIDTMDTDLDLVKLALEQEEITRRHELKIRKRNRNRLNSKNIWRPWATSCWPLPSST